MADAKQLKIKIGSTQNIKKITNALEIISTLKLQKVKKQTLYLKECMLGLVDIISHIHAYKDLFNDLGSSATSNPRILLVVLGTEKGLCGSLNTQLFKHLHTEYEGQKDKITIIAVGKKAKEYFSRRGYTIQQTLHMGDSVTIESAQEIVRIVQTIRQEKSYDEIILGYNVFKNTMKYIPSLFPLYPMTSEKLEGFLREALDTNIINTTENDPKDMIFEPSMTVIKEKLYGMVMHYVIYGSIYQNKTCEFASRMLAMKGAKDNATTQIKSLTLAFNKARQDAITREIIEVCGAKSVIE